MISGIDSRTNQLTRWIRDLAEMRARDLLQL